uniref:Tyrosinase_Cu-bd domain-containing protein n=1 Tax=Panagrellus redivivus TaxID=6233 RepID=A0A7E4WAD2_PANRE
MSAKALWLISNDFTDPTMRRLPIVVLFAIFWQVAIAQFVDDCSDAPNAALKRVCLRMRKGDSVARERFARQAIEEISPPSMPGSPVWQQPVPVPANARGQIATHPYDCMTLLCLCPFFGGRMGADGNCMLQNGNPLQMAYRKEYRVMTDDERARFHNALNALKRSGEYDRLSAEHQLVGSGSGAHSGPGFLPWHREYLKRVELALRLIDPGLFIPYWDSVMDGYLEDPRDSILFTNEFIGETDFNGFVLSGPFAYWRTLEGRPYILRTLGREGQLFTEQQVNQVMEQTNVEYVMAYTVPLPGCPYPTNYGAIEYSHSNIHLWLGGDMGPPTTSANDPIFYMHHSFVDHIWENWRQLRQPRWVREQAFTPDLPQCANPQHFSYAQMRPFNLINRDGLSNSYTDQMYRYAPRATCTAAAPTCGSKYLFCDTRGYPHCVAKVKLGGLCSRFMGFDVCYMGQCIFGRCVPGPTPPPFVARQQTAAPVVQAPARRQQPAAAVTRRPFVNCFNRNPCCDTWAANGECNSNRKYMGTYCRAACKICTPSFNITNECANRHVSCVQWQQSGECSGNSQMFMLENCRQQCNLCGTPKANQCQRAPHPRPRVAANRKQSPKPQTPFVRRH